MIVDGQEEMGDDAFDEAAEGLAAYVTLDEWLRTIDPADAELQDRILAEHPEVADWVCGSAVAVDETDAATVRDQLKAGASLDQVADDVATLARTPPGGECLTRGLFRRQLVDLLYGTPVGSAGEKTVVSRSTGQPVVFFVAPTIRDDVTGADAGRRRDRHAATPPRRRRRRVLRARLLHRRSAPRRQLGNVGPDRRRRRGRRGTRRGQRSTCPTRRHDHRPSSTTSSAGGVVGVRGRGRGDPRRRRARRSRDRRPAGPRPGGARRRRPDRAGDKRCPSSCPSSRVLRRCRGPTARSRSERCTRRGTGPGSRRSWATSSVIRSGSGTAARLSPAPRRRAGRRPVSPRWRGGRTACRAATPVRLRPRPSTCAGRRRPGPSTGSPPGPAAHPRTG